MWFSNKDNPNWSQLEPMVNTAASQWRRLAMYDSFEVSRRDTQTEYHSTTCNSSKQSI